ncbi:hypothetical protein Q5Y75_15150 [Ruegeria sp. 2205SS24-7]|uniref:hypothetical protein n=1 Tax=Ruegeria discodermiae TaxID=3064389 RepID=UPI00274275FB|nr:hypothetical protein [Ruegeria sp. 2205SS24-7]MDP5218564.1 hypothetical protein [Ruegeria sp. 2205SS24-7]
MWTRLILINVGPIPNIVLSLQNWWLIDLRAFRAALIRHGANGSFICMGDKRNPYGTCFKWFDIRSFPDDPPLVVAHG